MGNLSGLYYVGVANAHGVRSWNHAFAFSAMFGKRTNLETMYTKAVHSMIKDTT